MPTLGALLQDEYAAEIRSSDDSGCAANGKGESGCKPVTEDTGWRFCDSPDCDVVYFAESGEGWFTKSQLRVAVGVKERTGERPLCYCFGHSVESIKEELKAKDHSEALEDIRRKMKDPGCRCEVTNPSGSCCLGSVARGIEIAKKELAMAVNEREPPAAPPPSGSLGEKISKAGAIISAIVASSCCWLPLFLLALGVSGVGIASTLEAYRPVFIVVTFAFLGAAFYFTYRPRKAISEAAHGCCATEPTDAEGCCATPKKRRISMMTMNKVMLWVVTALAVAFLFFPSYVGLLLGTNGGSPVTGDMNRATLEISGMTCEGCAATVEAALRAVPGVSAAAVSYEKKQATIFVPKGEDVPRNALLEAVRKVGYQAQFIEEPARNEGVPQKQSEVH
ncbi:MAG: cation transporter [Planctomycetia bacterium]|nr:cation transporter [Planctomycetia bacterium]